MAQYQVVFHVDEESENGANEWKLRAHAILTENKQFLVGKSGNGSFCEGHVMDPVSSENLSNKPSDANVLKMGPRQ